MRAIILWLVLSNGIFAQTYGYPDPNNGPDHGSAKNFGVSERKGVPSVCSELLVNGQTYCYIKNTTDGFKLSRKQGGEFTDIIPKLITAAPGAGMDEYSRLLHVYEDNKVINIYSWGARGYQFNFYQKRQNQQPGLIRSGYIQNTIHSVMAFDETIKSIEFNGAAQMTITKKPAVAGAKRDTFEFKSPGVYEFRSDGVYLDGIFDPSVQDREPQNVVAENLRKDPQHYLKRQDLHAERVASYTKELMDAEAARVAALPPKPTPSPIIKPTLPVAPVAPITTVPALPKPVVVAAAEPVVTQNLSSWLAGLVALVAMLLAYLGWRYFGKKASS